MNHEPEIMQGLSPIFGETKSSFIRGNGYIKLGTLGNYGSSLNKGFYIGIDVQPEGNEPCILFGSGASGRTSLVIKVNEESKKGKISFELQDDEGRRLYSNVQTSKYAAKRLIISVDVKQNLVSFYEMNLLRDAGLLNTTYVYRESPSVFSDFKHDVLVGGACIDGISTGSITTKLSNLFLGLGPLSREKVEAFIAASRNDINSFYGKQIYEVNNSEERRQLFLDDLDKIESLAKKSRFSNCDTRDCSTIYFKWLFDKNPLLQDLCNELGIQLTFPGESESRKHYHEAVAKDKPLILLPLIQGKSSLLGHRWIPLKDFANDMAFTIKGHKVSIEAFIKFVRHKLGGGHFDDKDRKKWQKDVVAMSSYAKNDKNFMNHQMKALTITLLEAVEENRIAIHAKA